MSSLVCQCVRVFLCLRMYESVLGGTVCTLDRCAELKSFESEFLCVFLLLNELINVIPFLCAKWDLDGLVHKT